MLSPETVKSFEVRLSAGGRPTRLTVGAARVAWGSIWEGKRFES